MRNTTLKRMIKERNSIYKLRLKKHHTGLYLIMRRFVQGGLFGDAQAFAVFFAHVLFEVEDFRLRFAEAGFQDFDFAGLERYNVVQVLNLLFLMGEHCFDFDDAVFFHALSIARCGA